MISLSGSGGLKAQAKYIAILLVFTVTSISLFPVNSYGYLLQSGEIGAETGSGELQRTLESKAVRSELLARGISAAEVDAVMAKLTDEDIHEMALNIESLYGGGSILGGVVAILVVMLIALFVLDQTGHKLVIESSDGGDDDVDVEPGGEDEEVIEEDVEE